jgi:nitrite reductase/ring-hydroxylating ferredoxin subunit
MSEPVAAAAVCPLEALPQGRARGFTLRAGRERVEIFLYRNGRTVLGYVNSCPHIGTPLDWVPDQFMAPDGEHFQCATHGARFRTADGYCVFGPCVGKSLRALALALREGLVRIEAPLPTP